MRALKVVGAVVMLKAIMVLTCMSRRFGFTGDADHEGFVGWEFHVHLHFSP
jgi:hypothetical protein